MLCDLRVIAWWSGAIAFRAVLLVFFVSSLTACTWEQLIGKEHVPSYVEGDKCFTRKQALQAERTYLMKVEMDPSWGEPWSDPIEIRDGELEGMRKREWIFIYETPRNEKRLMGVRWLSVDKATCNISPPLWFKKTDL